MISRLNPIPSPGEGPFVARSEIPNKAPLRGMAPIGVPWHAKMVRGQVKPDGDCPPGEFALTHALVQGRWHEVTND